MKKFLICILCLGLCLSGWGCKNSQAQDTDLLFYYRPVILTYGRESSAIQAEIREDVQTSRTIEDILSIYLQGPESAQLSTPFPQNVTVVSVIQEGDLFDITLSPQFALLKGLNLVIACGCLTLTILDMTDAVEVQIRAQDSLLDGAKSINMNRNSILLLDKGAKKDSQ